jgi:hypothetical protein
MPSSWRQLYFQTEVDVWHRLVHRARAQDINLYSHIMSMHLHVAWGPLTSDSTLAQVDFGYAPACLEHELLTLPFPAFTQTSRHRNQLAALDIVEHYHISPGRDGFVSLLFVAYFDIQEKRKATNFACASDGGGDRSCPGSS